MSVLAGGDALHLNRTREVLHSVVTESCSSLLHDFGCTTEIYEESESNLDQVPTAIIDAGSDELEIGLAIKSPLSVLAMTYPIPVEQFGEVEDSALEDWISELSNQLIGRVKNSLVKRGCFVNIGLPDVFHAGEWQGFEPASREVKQFVYRVDGEDCELHVCIEIFDPAFTINEEDCASADIQESGEIELF